MPDEQLTRHLLTLPLSQRVDLAQALWQSINQGLDAGTEDEEHEAIRQAKTRDAELTADASAGRSHQQVMEATRRAVGCE